MLGFHWNKPRVPAVLPGLVPVTSQASDCVKIFGIEVATSAKLNDLLKRVEALELDRDEK